jgi:hypothetical protein
LTWANADDAGTAPRVITVAAAAIAATARSRSTRVRPWGPYAAQQVDPGREVLGGHGEQVAYGFLGVVHDSLLHPPSRCAALVYVALHPPSFGRHLTVTRRWAGPGLTSG